MSRIENPFRRVNRASSLIGWSTGRNYTLRVPDTDGRRVELRSPDALCNPYLACALSIYAGLYGIQKNLPLPAAASPESADERRKLPATLRDAVAAASDSAFIRERLPASVIAAYCQRGGTPE